MLVSRIFFAGLFGCFGWIYWLLLWLDLLAAAFARFIGCFWLELLAAFAGPSLTVFAERTSWGDWASKRMRLARVPASIKVIFRRTQIFQLTTNRVWYSHNEYSIEKITLSSCNGQQVPTHISCLFLSIFFLLRTCLAYFRPPRDLYASFLHYSPLFQIG